MQVFRNTGIQRGNPVGLQIKERPKSNGQTTNSIMQALATKARNAPTPINVKQVIPTKKQIREYCMQDKEYANLWQQIRDKVPGHSSRITRAKNLLEKDLVKKLPFGPILP